MSVSISERLNPNRNPKDSFVLKADYTLNRITLNPSSANPGETLYITIPKLKENVVIVPGSVNLLFDLNVVGHANNTLVNKPFRENVACIIAFHNPSHTKTLFEEYGNSMDSETRKEFVKLLKKQKICENMFLFETSIFSIFRIS